MENLYFIAIIPNEKVCAEIEAFKSDFAEHFESRYALKVIPHITLKAPFKLANSKHADLLKWFKKLFFNTSPFQIELKNFGAFHNKNNPVVYVQPIINTSLFELQAAIIRSFRISYPETGVLDIESKFKPHITVAYRDLTHEKFLSAWKIYQKKIYNAVFNVSGFHLLQHDRKKWNVIETRNL